MERTSKRDTACWRGDRGQRGLEGQEKVTYKQCVALVILRARTVGLHDLSLAVQVAGVEELEVLVPQLAAGRQVPRDVVQLAQAPGEGDVRVVCEACVAEHGKAVLEASDQSIS